MTEFTIFPYAVAFLIKETIVHNKTEQEIVLIHRLHTGFGDGMYSLIGGKVAKNESALQALVREVFEEVGAIIDPQDAQFSHIVYFKGATRVHVSFVFTVREWQGEIANREPDKHDHIQWFNLDDLPTNILFPHGQIIDCIKRGILYSDAGFAESL